MRLRVDLTEGQNPRTYDAETGEDLTDRVREIQIKPLRTAYAVLYRRKEGGNFPYIDEDTLDVATINVPVERIEGVWVADKGELEELRDLGMDNFDLFAAREAIIRLQSFPTPEGWKNEEVEQFNVAMEALFPGEEGAALLKQMTERIEQKKA